MESRRRYGNQRNENIGAFTHLTKWKEVFRSKDAGNPEASELFKEVAYSYSILSDPEKRRQYDNAGFEVVSKGGCELQDVHVSQLRDALVLQFTNVNCGVNEATVAWKYDFIRLLFAPFTLTALDTEGMDMEIDLSNLGTVNTMFAALFSKLGVPIKTTISATVLEEALNGTVTVRPLPLGTSVTGKVEKQCAHFFGVTINEEQAQSGIVVRVTSAAQSKFKSPAAFLLQLLYFEQEANGGYGLALQEDSEKTGKATSAGMYFLHFQVYRMDSTMNALAMAKDPEAAFFKRLEGLQPCEVLELKAGTHIFATATYTIEALCAKTFEETTQKLKDIEAQILAKRNELRQFETEYRKALARFQEVTNRYSQEKQSVDELLKQRDSIHSTFTVTRTLNNASTSSSSKTPNDDFKGESPAEDGSSEKDKSSKKKWFNLNLKGSDKKLG
ncbi:Chaperone protein dnaJ 15 [Asimina triloba]